ncbi:MAG: hypothetical protein KDI37_12190 [Xanthomonadales bacterium]|nr:hypothetical protein [Xanthomonadales bacterium]
MRLGFDHQNQLSITESVKALNTLTLTALLAAAEASPSEAASSYGLSRRMVLRLGGMSRSDLPILATSAVLLYAPTATASLDDGLRHVEEARLLDIADDLMQAPGEMNYQSRYLAEIARAVDSNDPIVVGMRFRLDPTYCARIAALDPAKRESLGRRINIPFGFTAHMLMSMVATAVVGGDRDDSNRVNTMLLSLAVEASRELAS